MNAFSYINFNDFTTSQICDLIVERIYKATNEYLDNIYKYIGDELFIKDSSHTQFNKVYLLLVDEIKQLMRLEANILFTYLKSNKVQKRTDQSTHINIIAQRQKNIQQLMLETRITFHQLSQSTPSSIEQKIIENDLFHLESVIKEWFLIVNQKLITLLNKQSPSLL